MKIRWYEILVLALTALCALVFLATYLSTAWSSGVTVSTQRGSAWTTESDGAEEDGEGDEAQETGETSEGLRGGARSWTTPLLNTERIDGGPQI